VDVSQSLQAQVKQYLGAYPTVSGNTTQGVTDDSITIGIMGDVTAGGNAIFPGICDGAKARIQRANDSHELKHKIVIAGCTDTGADPAQAQSAENQYALSKKVFGMINMSLLSAANDDILAQHHIPYVGWGVTPGFCGKDAAYGFGDSGAGVCNAVSTESNGKYELINELMIAAYLRGAKKSPSSVKLALVGDDGASSKQSVTQEARNAKAAGVNVVYAGNPLPSNAAAATNVQPLLSPVIAAKPTVVYNLTSSTTPLIAGLKQAGYTGDFWENSFTDSSAFQSPQLAQLLDGEYGVSPGIGSSTFGGTGWTTVENDAKAINYSGGLTIGFLHTYIDADLWIQMIKDFEGTGKQFTTENLVNFVNAGWIYKGYENVSSPISFPAGHYVGTSCASTVKFDTPNKKVLPVADLTCAPASIKAS
jgi:hypothetical protein